MRSGIRIGVDVGTVRIGLSRSDPHGILATPVETVGRDAKGTTDIARIAHLADTFEAVEAIVGLPLGLSGLRTASTDDAINFAQRLAQSIDIPVRLVDERLSTVSAQNALRANGRRAKDSRAVVDQLAAVILLQHALDTERDSGSLPGDHVTPIRET